MKEETAKRIIKTIGSFKKAKDFGKFTIKNASQKRAERKMRRQIVGKAQTAEAYGKYHSAGTLYAQAGYVKKAVNAYEQSANLNEITGNYEAAAASYAAAGSIDPEYAEKYNFKIDELRRKDHLRRIRQSPESHLVEMAEAAAVFILFAGAFVFLPTSISGKAIAGISSSDSSSISFMLFLLGILVAYASCFDKK